MSRYTADATVTSTTSASGAAYTLITPRRSPSEVCLYQVQNGKAVRVASGAAEVQQFLLAH